MKRTVVVTLAFSVGFFGCSSPEAEPEQSKQIEIPVAIDTDQEPLTMIPEANCRFSADNPKMPVAPGIFSVWAACDRSPSEPVGLYGQPNQFADSIGTAQHGDKIFVRCTLSGQELQDGAGIGPPGDTEGDPHDSNVWVVGEFVDGSGRIGQFMVSAVC